MFLSLYHIEDNRLFISSVSIRYIITSLYQLTPAPVTIYFINIPHTEGVFSLESEYSNRM